MQTIGRFFAEEWQLALSNSEPFYTPAPNAGMMMDELLSIQQKLSDLVSYWLNQVVSNTNESAILNAQAIADLEASKLNTVNEIISLRESAGGTELTVTDPVYTTEPAKDNTMLWIIGGLVAFGFYWKYRKKQRRAAKS